MRLTLKTKVLLLALVPVILFALVLSGAVTQVIHSLAEDEVKNTRERLVEESRHGADTARSLARLGDSLGGLVKQFRI